jgi:hypothetical protein
MLTTPQLINLLASVEADVCAWHDTRHTADGRATIATCKAEFASFSVAQGGGRNPYFLTRADHSAKLGHNKADAIEQVVMYQAAHRLSGVVNVCAMSTKGCRAGCLGVNAGRMVYDQVKRAQVIRTRFMVENPFAFFVCLLAEVDLHNKRVGRKGKTLAVRLNGTSDIPWEQLPWFVQLVTSVAERMFDYTKYRTRRGRLAPNYTAHYSVSERDSYSDVQPGDVVVVDQQQGTSREGRPLPETWAGMPVIDGDYEHGDMRFLDSERPDAVVLLRAKGKVCKSMIGSESGFVKPQRVAAPTRRLQPA